MKETSALPFEMIYCKGVSGNTQVFKWFGSNLTAVSTQARRPPKSLAANRESLKAAKIPLRLATYVFSLHFLHSNLA